MLHDYTTVTPETVRAETDAAIRIADALVDGAVASEGAPTFDSTLVPLELASASLVGGYGRGAFMGQAHPDAEVRRAGSAAEELIDKWRVALVARSDVYRAVRGFAQTDAAAALDGEDARLLEHWLRDFRRAGHDLPDAEREELERLNSRLVELKVAFQRNINDYRDGIDVTREQLAGLPDAYVERLKPGDTSGTYRVSLDYPEIGPFLEQAHDRVLRRMLFVKDWNKAAAENRPLLDEVLDVRRRIAALLGAPTWADHAMELKMARSPQRVRDFYATLLPSLEKRLRADLDNLRGRLAADGHDEPVTAWDWRYYDETMRRTEYGVDQDRVSEYLPLEPVIDGMFELTGEVLGLSYRVVEDARAWHPSVRLYEILDRGSGHSIAHFYADLHPRDGKFSHAAAFPLVTGHRAADGSFVAPVSAILANFTPPSATRPALLRHSEVKTLFHEFGHILHMSLSRASYTRFSGGETEWDFVEAPSQIMEHWTWEPSVLRRVSRHHATGEPIPDELIQDIGRARWVNVGIRLGLQAFYGQLDLALHGEAAAVDPDEALRRTHAVTGMPYPDGTYMLGGFGHLMDYDAGYYGYLWAEVIGDDLFGRFVQEGIASPLVGADYRRQILEPNGTRDAADLVRAFLGRDPSNEEFLRRRGLG